MASQGREDLKKYYTYFDEQLIRLEHFQIHTSFLENRGSRDVLGSMKNIELNLFASNPPVDYDEFVNMLLQK